MVSTDPNGVALNTTDVTKAGTVRYPDASPNPGGRSMQGTAGTRDDSNPELTAPGSEPGAMSWPADAAVDRELGTGGDRPDKGVGA
jgi:hypothetical protein